jgi:hypothetical protein
VRLTVTHEEFGDDQDMLKSVSFGWPAVISGLKTLLETGRAMPATTYFGVRRHGAAEERLRGGSWSNRGLFKYFEAVLT